MTEKLLSRPLTFLKLGGSIITDKDIPMSVREEVLADLVSQVAKARSYLEKNHEQLIVGHGQGSFAHMPAAQYKTMGGFINEESVLGMAIVQDSAAQLNRFVVHAFIRHELPAVTLAPSNILITKNREPVEFFLPLVEAYLDKGLWPVTGGDVIVDQAQGCTIWSTEEVLAYLAVELQKRQRGVRRIIHVTEVPGVLDATGQVVPRLTPANWPTVKKAIGRTKGFDVTGGMLLKVEESLDLLQYGIESLIISGLEPNNLYKALVGEKWQGTLVTAQD
jgi:isopentenyl phosphate kinase